MVIHGKYIEYVLPKKKRERKTTIHYTEPLKLWKGVLSNAQHLNKHARTGPSGPGYGTLN